MSELFDSILIGEAGDILIDNRVTDDYLDYLHREPVDENYSRLIGLPIMRDVCYTSGSGYTLFLTEEGKLFYIDKDNQGIILDLKLPPIKRIFNSRSITLLDITNTLSFLHGRMRILSSQSPIEDVKKVIIDSERELTILVGDNKLITGRSDELNVTEYDGIIENIFYESMVDSTGMICDFFQPWKLRILDVIRVDYHVDDCIKYSEFEFITLSDGVLRRYEAGLRGIFEAERISVENKFTRFIIINRQRLVEDAGGNLYYLPDVGYYPCPIRLMNPDTTPLIMSKSMKGSHTRLE